MSRVSHLRTRYRAQAGFTLLEVIVAFAIMAMALSMLYQILGSNVRAVGVTGEYQRASMLAQSLLNGHDGIPEQGWNEQGFSGGFDWSVSSRPYVTTTQNQYPQAVPLHEITIEVSWHEGGQPRSLHMSTLRPMRVIEGRRR